MPEAAIVSIGKGYEAEQLLRVALNRKPTKVLIAYETDGEYAYYTWSNMKLRDVAWLMSCLQAAVDQELTGAAD